MSNFMPENEQEAMAFLEKRKRQDEMEKFTEDCKALKADPSKLLEIGGFKRDVDGVNFQKVLTAFEMIKARPKKGIIITGAVGTGKTLALNSLFPFIRICRLADVCQLKMLVPKKDEDGDKFWDVPKEDIILDDIGNEAIKSDYSVMVDVLCDFIMYWHTEKYEDPKDKNRIFATTNLDMKQLQDRYGDRIVDRLIAMCIFVRFEGTSKREKPIII